MYRHVPASRAREDLADLLNDVAFKGERVVLSRHGKGVVAMISIDDLALLEELEDRMDTEALRRARAESGPNIPWETLRQES
jgi:prevent-host-death family protein